MTALNKVYRCLIVDDNEIDRLTTVSFVKRYPFLQIDGVFESPIEAVRFAATSPPDVVFLDIDMPGLNGFELRKELQKVPVCIFITSYPEYALESFDLAALDFLVKPLKGDRFEKSMERLMRYLDVHHKAELLDYTIGDETLFIKDGHDHIKLQMHEIIYLEALKDYTGIITPQKKYCVLSPLGTMLKEKAFKSFIRIHRSYAVQKHFIKKIASREVTVNDILLPIGRSYKDELDRLISL